MRTRFLALIALLAACNAPKRYVGALDDTGDTGDTGGGETGDGDAYATEWVQFTVNKNVDLLMVFDNSSSMGQEQTKVAQNVGAFIVALEADGVEANYRIALTTTDVGGNAWCGAATTPEAGRFVASSCRGRLGDFQSEDPPQDVSDIGCTDICPYEPDELDDLMKPTPIDQAPGLAVRPWLESIEGATNLPDNVGTIEAFACLAPQGISGCGFESPLEAMRLALARAQDPGDPAYGFMRPNALLAVVIVTDEADCSTQDFVIFDPDGTRVFWSDPDAAEPTSAVCWSAGVKCSGEPDVYDECHAVDLDENGVPTTDAKDAVLYPVDRYVDFLQGIELQKKQLDPEAEVIVSVVSGVPDGYHDGYADITYAQSPDPEFETEYGIGPGCADLAEDQTALPPVRLREWAEAFGDRNLYSVCNDDHTPAFQEIADRIASQIRPACFETCVADVDADAPGLQVDCTVREYVPAEDFVGVAPCELVGDAYEVPEGANVCWQALTDRTQMPPAIDDLSDLCIDGGSNLEFRVLRRPGFPAVGGSHIEATCRRSEDPGADCPG